jgi:hypothetical protein
VASRRGCSFDHLNEDSGKLGFNDRSLKKEFPRHHALDILNNSGVPSLAEVAEISLVKGLSIRWPIPYRATGSGEIESRLALKVRNLAQPLHIFQNDVSVSFGDAVEPPTVMLHALGVEFIFALGFLENYSHDHAFPDMILLIV